jgi:UDP-glucose:(glucosyl)LPS beta-1,3-glucosyltransferase
MRLPLISIIIPAYNVEDRIESTLRSILAQDYVNIEIILVNDSSTDKTADLARDVLEKSNRTWRIIEHSKNKGVCGARNTGIDASMGDYLQFTDADDLMEISFISTLYRTSAKNKGDIAFCGFKCRDISTGKDTMNSIALNDNKIYRGEDLVMMFLSHDFFTSVCTLLFKRDFLVSTGLKFTVGCVRNGDIEFLLKAMTRAERVAFSKECLYIYIQHDNMYSRRSLTTFATRLQRYICYIQSYLRVSHYISEHAQIPSLIYTARYVSMPKYLLNLFNILAWRNDKEAFNKFLRSHKARYILWSSYKVFFKEPQHFLKTLCLFAFPNAYYKYRSKHIRQDIR